MELNLMNKQKVDSYFMNLSCEEITYSYETYFKKPKESINYTRCCKSDRELLTCDTCKHKCLVWDDDHPCTTCAGMDKYTSR